MQEFNFPSFQLNPSKVYHGEYFLSCQFPNLVTVDGVKHIQKLLPKSIVIVTETAECELLITISSEAIYFNGSIGIPIPNNKNSEVSYFIEGSTSITIPISPNRLCAQYMNGTHFTIPFLREQFEKLKQQKEQFVKKSKETIG